jgi:hypothetical protein
MGHKMICYDDEGRLGCVCGLQADQDADAGLDEAISRAEADELVNTYTLTATAAVLDAIFPPDKP